MERRHFDALTRSFTAAGSRRAALFTLVTGSLGALGASEALAKKNKDKNKKKRKRKRKSKQRTNAPAESCWRAGACVPQKGANVSQCDLAGYVAPADLNCTGCNLSRANLRGADFGGTNFTRANLSGACLIDADFTAATFTSTTNLSDAIFCNTILPDGSVNNSGCNGGTACCSTCTATTCAELGYICGSWPDGCGGTLQCGTCPNGQSCDDGTSCQNSNPEMWVDVQPDQVWKDLGGSSQFASERHVVDLSNFTEVKLMALVKTAGTGLLRVDWEVNPNQNDFATLVGFIDLSTAGITQTDYVAIPDNAQGLINIVAVAADGNGSSPETRGVAIMVR